jgi:VanZ family protein
MGEVSTRGWPAPAVTSERLVTALLGYFVFITLVITLSPFDFGPPVFRLSLMMKLGDMVLNVGLFLPIGFLLRSLGSLAPKRCSRAVLLAAAFSVLIEAAQMFLGRRFVSPIDVLTNTCGACAGVFLRERVERWTLWYPQVVGRIGLDIPLVGLLYLLVPQLWLSSVGLVQDAWRSVTTLLLGCAGSIVLVSLQRHRWQGGVRVAANVVPPLAFLWFLVGALPALTGSPQAFGTMALALVLVTLLLLRRGVEEHEQRFEAQTLQQFLPIFAVYLVVAALWPPYRALSPWHGAIGFLDHCETPASFQSCCCSSRSRVHAPRLRAGRVERTQGPGPGSRLTRRDDGRPRLCHAARGGAGPADGPGASVLRALMATAGAVYGASVYHLARTHVRALRSEQRSHDIEERRRAALTARGYRVVTFRSRTAWAVRVSAHVPARFERIARPLAVRELLRQQRRVERRARLLAHVIGDATLVVPPLLLQRLG